jgi:hypothetical protein
MRGIMIILRRKAARGRRRWRGCGPDACSRLRSTSFSSCSPRARRRRHRCSACPATFSAGSCATRARRARARRWRAAPPRCWPGCSPRRPPIRASRPRRAPSPPRPRRPRSRCLTSPSLSAPLSLSSKTTSLLPSLFPPKPRPLLQLAVELCLAARDQPPPPLARAERLSAQVVAAVAHLVTAGDPALLRAVALERGATASLHRLLLHGEGRVRRLALVSLLYLTRRLAPETFRPATAPAAPPALAGTPPGLPRRGARRGSRRGAPGGAARLGTRASHAVPSAGSISPTPAPTWQQGLKAPTWQQGLQGQAARRPLSAPRAGTAPQTRRGGAEGTRAGRGAVTAQEAGARRRGREAGPGVARMRAGRARGTRRPCCCWRCPTAATSSTSNASTRGCSAARRRPHPSPAAPRMPPPCPAAPRAPARPHSCCAREPPAAAEQQRACGGEEDAWGRMGGAPVSAPGAYSWRGAVSGGHDQPRLPAVQAAALAGPTGPAARLPRDTQLVKELRQRYRDRGCPGPTLRLVYSQYRRNNVQFTHSRAPWLANDDPHRWRSLPSLPLHSFATTAPSCPSFRNALTRGLGGKASRASPQLAARSANDSGPRFRNVHDKG